MTMSCDQGDASCARPMKIAEAVSDSKRRHKDYVTKLETVAWAAKRYLSKADARNVDGGRVDYVERVDLAMALDALAKIS